MLLFFRRVIYNYVLEKKELTDDLLSQALTTHLTPSAFESCVTVLFGTWICAEWRPLAIFDQNDCILDFDLWRFSNYYFL